MGSDERVVNEDMVLFYVHHTNNKLGVPDTYFGLYLHWLCD